MSSVLVRDFTANAEENIVHAANVIGRSPIRQAIFKAIYHHKAKVKSVEDIRKRTGLIRMRILQEAGRFASKRIVDKAKKNGDTAYGKHDDLHAYKNQILARANSKALRDRTPTKRNLKATVKLTKVASISARSGKARRLFIDDIDSFKKVRKIHAGDVLAQLTMSEDEFKRGVQRILAEPGNFKDWGGEKSDLYTSRVVIDGRRRSAAFAFKGPGQKGALTIDRMGKRGNQALRLIYEEADVFFIQHWREITSDVVDHVRRYVASRAAEQNRDLIYCFIDGNDSQRLCAAYRSQFKKKGS